MYLPSSPHSVCPGSEREPSICNCVLGGVGGWCWAVWGRVREPERAEGGYRGLKGAIIHAAQWALCAGGHGGTEGSGAGRRAAPCHNVCGDAAQERGGEEEVKG